VTRRWREPHAIRSDGASVIARILQGLLTLQLLVTLMLASWLWRNGWAGPGLALALAALVPLLIQSSLIGLECLIAWWVRDTPDPADDRIGHWLRAWLTECVASIRTFNLAQPLLSHRPVDSVPNQERPHPVPVLLIHGYFCNRALWRPMARRLAAQGHAVHAINLEPPFASIDRYAPQIEAAVSGLLARSGAPQVALVCHSMGGLAARAWLREHGDERVQQVITLGTPHRGTVLARFGHGRNVRQMRRDSDWLRTLAQHEAAQAPERRHRWLLIRSWQDNIVMPQALQTLPGARALSFAGLGHVGLVYDPGVQQAVIEALQAAPGQRDVRSEYPASVAGRPPDRH